ncbi:MAG: hypothetical protein QW734_02145 [Candidatus Bathyarchaeia archaeon]
MPCEFELDMVENAIKQFVETAVGHERLAHECYLHFSRFACDYLHSSEWGVKLHDSASRLSKALAELNRCLERLK